MAWDLEPHQSYPKPKGIIFKRKYLQSKQKPGHQNPLVTTFLTIKKFHHNTKGFLMLSNKPYCLLFNINEDRRKAMLQNPI